MLKNIRFSTVILLFGAVLSLAWSLYFERSILATPYQIGYREGAPQVLTSMLIHGENPYIFENQPLAFNNYSIAYSAVVLPFALMFGNTLHIHRWVTFIFILLSTSLGFWVVFKRGRNLSTALICCAFIISGFLGRGGVGSAPTTMGTFLFLAAIFIPYLRSFDNASMAISAVLALLALHTKAYFVLSFGIVLLYVFLLISKKKAINYFLLFLTLFVVAFAVIRLSYPLYFINAFRGNVSNTFRTLEHLLSQLMWLSIYFGPILTLTLIALWKDKASLKVTNIRLDISSWDKPFLEIPFDYYLYAFIICILTFVFVLGSHVGNYLSYAYELVVPTFLLWFFVRIDQKKVLTGLSAAIILVNLFCWQNATIGPNLLGDRNSVEWEKLFSYLKPSMNVLNSPTITSRLIELGIKPVDSGQTDYYYTMKPYEDNFLLGPSYEEFYNDGQQYTQSINESITAQQYDLIVTSKDVDVFYDLDLIAEHYEMVDQLILYMPATEQKWVVEVWERK